MPQRSTHAVDVRVGAVVRFGAVTLLPIERTVLRQQHDRKRLWCWASRELDALIVRDANGLWAVDAGAEAVSIDGLCGRVAGLGGMLAAM